MHNAYMKRCIQLALNGRNTTAPNPLVGCVIVYNNSIIGEGWHYKAGEPHAEVHAITSVKDRSLLSKSTIYVSLEPCSHFGRTPPCSDLIIKSGIKNVVIGTIDPFAKVSGAGIRKLMQAGCEVIVGVLEEECLKLNTHFITYHTKKRPYIILKWAMSADHFIAPKSKSNNKTVWITNATSKQLVHQWRAQSQAILVGSNTIIMDNPQLTTRQWYGKNPIRVVLSLSGNLPQHTNIFDKRVKTIVITSNEYVQSNSENLIYESIDNEQELTNEICNILYKHQIQSVIIEGGTMTLQTFLNANMWDETRVFTANNILFNSGVKAPNFTKHATITKELQNDTLRICFND